MSSNGGALLRRETSVANILVIEDNVQIQRAYGRMLRIAGPHNVTMVASGEDAIEHIQKNPLLDIIMSDFNIDGMLNGEQVFRWVENKHPKLARKYIFISDSERAKKLCEEYSLPYLQKPVDNATILETMGKILEALSGHN